MTQVLMRKEFGGLRPDSEDAYRILNKIGNGASVTVDVRDMSSRSGKQHGFFFVLVTLLFESQEYFKDCETFRKCLLIKLGFCDLHTFQDGTVVPVAHSVKPSKMLVDEFKRLVDAVLDFAVSVGFDRKEIEAEARRRSPDPRQDQGRG